MRSTDQNTFKGNVMSTKISIILIASFLATIAGCSAEREPTPAPSFTPVPTWTSTPVVQISRALLRLRRNLLRENQGMPFPLAP